MPTDILREEHRSIERALSLLEKAADRVRRGEPIPLEIFRGALQFIRLFADECHHHKEEDLLFPAMERKGFPANHGPIAVMLSEHEEGRLHVRGMIEAIERYEKHDSAAASSLASHAFAFVSLLRSHIQKEDNVLFLMADQHLKREDQEELLAEFTRVEQSGDACTKKSELLVLLDRLERQIN